MRVTTFLLGACASLIFGCSSLPKNKVDNASPGGALTQQGVTTAQPGQEDATVKAEGQQNELTCKRDQEARTLKVEGSQSKGCKLFYSNYSSKDAVAWSHTGNIHCEQVRDRIQGRLENAGFKCSPKNSASSK